MPVARGLQSCSAPGVSLDRVEVPLSGRSSSRDHSNYEWQPSMKKKKKLGTGLTQGVARRKCKWLELLLYLLNSGSHPP